MTTTQPTTSPIPTHAVVSDVTPNRATVIYCGSEEECSDFAIYGQDPSGPQDGRLVRIACDTTPELDERVWVDGRCTRIEARA